MKQPFSARHKAWRKKRHSISFGSTAHQHRHQTTAVLCLVATRHGQLQFLRRCPTYLNSVCHGLLGGDMAGSHPPPPPISNKNRSNSTQRYAVKVAVHPTISPSSTKGRLTISPPWWDFPSLDITSSLADTSTNQTNQPSKQPASTTTTTTVPCTLTLAGCKVHG